MKRFYRCGTNDTRCPNFGKEWFVVGDARAWKCPVERADCIRRRGRVSWAQRNRKLVRTLKLAVTVLVVTASVWFARYHLRVRALRALEVEAIALRDSARPLVKDLMDGYDKRITEIEGRLSKIGPEDGSEERVKSVKDESTELRNKLQSPAKEVELKRDVAVRLRLRLESLSGSKDVVPWDPERGALLAEQTRAALEEADLEIQKAMDGEQAKKLRDRFTPRMDALIGAASQVENALKLWKEAGEVVGALR